MDKNLKAMLEQRHKAQGQEVLFIENVTQDEADRIVYPLVQFIQPTEKGRVISVGWTKDGDSGYVDLVVKKEDKSFADKVREKEDEIVGHEWLKQEYRNLKGTIEQRLEKIEERLGLLERQRIFDSITDEDLDKFFFPKDPYAEAKQAYKDGCLQILIEDIWCDWMTPREPTWGNPSSEYRRKPEEKKASTKFFTPKMIMVDKDSAQDLLDLVHHCLTQPRVTVMNLGDKVGISVFE